jgi:hypothetical protein
MSSQVVYDLFYIYTQYITWLTTLFQYPIDMDEVKFIRRDLNIQKERISKLEKNLGG